MTPIFQDLATANVRNGGVKVDTNGFNVTIAQPLVHSLINGDAAADGGLIKGGAGTLTLTGVSTYTGATTINAGTLAVGSGGSLTNGSPVRVNAGASLAFSGTGSIKTGNGRNPHSGWRGCQPHDRHGLRRRAQRCQQRQPDRRHLHHQ